jgi:hypothetical protein
VQIERCLQMIACASKVEEVHSLFDAIAAVQEELSVLIFTKEIEIPNDLEWVVRNFERLDDIHERQFWFVRILDARGSFAKLIAVMD